MNLSQVSVEGWGEDPNPDLKPRLQAEEARLLRIIESLQTIQSSKEWSTLKIELFDNLVNVLEKDLKEESRKPDPSTNKLNRISGELKWAERFASLGKLENGYRIELQNVRLRLHGKKPE